MTEEKAECGNLSTYMQKLGDHLDQYLQFDHPDALQNATEWQGFLSASILDQEVGDKGVGIDQVIEEICRYLIPNGSQIPNPGCTAFITTGATTIGTLASLACSTAAPQRLGLTAFNFLEELSLQWMADIFGLEAEMKGVYSSGGSVANLLALGAARQWAFEKIGTDPAKEGVTQACRLYATQASHHTIHRAAAVLGMGRDSVVTIAADKMGRMLPDQLRQQLEADKQTNSVPVAIVANAGTTSTGAIDPLQDIGEIAQEHSIWFHIDGAYGLPGILDPQVKHLFQGLTLADSVIVDPHKWLGAPVGIGATYVRDRELLNRAFTQEAADYLEGSCITTDVQHSMDSVGIPYMDFSVELSAPSRGAVVWALLREIGIEGLRERVCRHNAMARLVAERADSHPNLEVVQQPMLSICCFRYMALNMKNNSLDLNELNRRIHRKLVHNGRNIPSTAMVDGVLAIRPCFLGARTTWQHAHDLVDEVLETGRQVIDEMAVNS